MSRPVARLSALACCLLLSLSTIACQVSPDPPAELPAEPKTSLPEAELTVDKPPFDYPGGWVGDACVDICGVTEGSPVERPLAVVCFDPDDADCAAKTGDGDYDYLLLSQHWLPSMCLGLDAGYDTTLTHQAGARCVPEAPSRITVHGLWPNYTRGFPQCCGSALPLDPAKVRQWPEELRTSLQHSQPDPTTTDFDPAICEIFNHEWQKHGTCFAAGGDGAGDVDADARHYFETGLLLADRLLEADNTLDGWAGTTQPRAAVEALYPKAVQVLCDAHQIERLLEIHTCWSRDLEMVDCPHTDGFGPLKTCGDGVTIPEWGEGS